MSSETARLVARARARLMRNGEICADVFGIAGDSAYYVPVPVFRDMCGDLTAREAARMLASIGALRKNGEGGFKHRKTWRGGRVIRVYVLEAAPLGLPLSPTAYGDWQGP